MVAPLDWGLGHATRCVPIVKELMNQKHEVLVASSGGALRLLQLEFPHLEFFELPSYRPIYSKSFNLIFALLPQVPKFLKAITHEHEHVAEIVKEKGVQVIISDHRYGCHSQNTKNIFITHQVHFQFQGFWKLGGGWVNRWHHRMMAPFQKIWIPDLPGSILSGGLSTKHGFNASYIGILSRFKLPTPRQKKYDLLVIVSGPEPQRSVFETLMKAEASKTNYKTLILKGKPSVCHNTESQGNITEVDHLMAHQLQEAIEQSHFVVCRSGYSTILDLARLKRNNILFVPTPGQPEQKYLAQVLAGNKLVHAVQQDSVCMKSDLELAIKYKGFADIEEQYLLEKAIASLKQI
ncbi:MAG: glycosyltransferase [Flammeovirgaceae bacterium]